MNTIRVMKVCKPTGILSKSRFISDNDTRQLSMMEEFCSSVQLHNNPICSVNNGYTNKVYSDYPESPADNIYWTLSHPYNDYAMIVNDSSVLMSIVNPPICTDPSESVTLKMYEYQILLQLSSDKELLLSDYFDRFKGCSILRDYNEIEDYLYNYASSKYDSILDFIGNNNDYIVEVKFDKYIN